MERALYSLYSNKPTSSCSLAPNTQFTQSQHSKSFLEIRQTSPDRSQPQNQDAGMTLTKTATPWARTEAGRGNCSLVVRAATYAERTSSQKVHSPAGSWWPLRWGCRSWFLLWRPRSDPSAGGTVSTLKSSMAVASTSVNARRRTQVSWSAFKETADSKFHKRKNCSSILLPPPPKKNCLQF